MGQRDGLCLHSLHLFIEQRWIIGNMKWMWLSSFIIILYRILELCNKDYQDFGKFNSLRNTLTKSRSNESFFVLAFYVDEATFKTCTHKRSEHNTEDDDLQLNFDIVIHNRYKDRRYLLGYLLMFPYIVQFCFNFMYYDYITETTNQSAKIENQIKQNQPQLILYRAQRTNVNINK